MSPSSFGFGGLPGGLGSIDRTLRFPLHRANGGTGVGGFCVIAIGPVIAATATIAAVLRRNFRLDEVSPDSIIVTSMEQLGLGQAGGCSGTLSAHEHSRVIPEQGSGELHDSRT